MAPWRKHLIEAQLEKVTKNNYEDVANRIVMILDSRSVIQLTSKMIVSRTNRWYMPTYSKGLDISKRNLCDNFLAKLLHGIALRTKPIKDVPTREGLSGIPLIKSDLLSTGLFGRHRIGPIVIALFNSGNMMIDDVIELVEICFDQYRSSHFHHRISDLMIILEFTAKEMVKRHSTQFVTFMEHLRTLLIENVDWAGKKVQIGEREIPNLFDRFIDLEREYKSLSDLDGFQTITNSMDHIDNYESIDSHSNANLDACSDDDQSVSFSQNVNSSAFSSSFDDDDDGENTESSLDGKSLDLDSFSIGICSRLNNSATVTPLYSTTTKEESVASSEERRDNNTASTAGTSTSTSSTTSLRSEIVSRVAALSTITPFNQQSFIQQQHIPSFVNERKVNPSKSKILQDVFVPLEIEMPEEGLIAENIIGEIGFKINDGVLEDKTPTVQKEQFDQSIVTPPMTPLHSRNDMISSIVMINEIHASIRFLFPSSVFTQEKVDLIIQTMENTFNKKSTQSANKISKKDDELIRDADHFLVTIRDDFHLLKDGSAFQTFHLDTEKEIDVIYSANMTLSHIHHFAQKIAIILAGRNDL